MLQKTWTLPTALSLSRIVLLIPFAYFLLAGVPNSRMWLAGVLFAGTLTDFFDGYLARRLHQVSDFGKIIDPLADKISIGVAAILLVGTGALPLWYVLIVVVRDLLILVGGMYIRAKKKIVTQSNWPGKFAVFFIAVVLFLSVLQLPSLETIREFMIWTSVALMAISIVLYAQRLFIGTVQVKGSAAR